MKIQPYIFAKQRKDGKNQSLWIQLFQIELIEDGQLISIFRPCSTIYFEYNKTSTR